MIITLPYKFTPREYQKPFFRAMGAGKKRAILLFHRRAGKDKTCINQVVMASQQRVGAYYYFLPTNVQGRKIIWDGMDYTGFRFLDHFPHELRDGINNNEMKLKLKNGSLFQVVGSDNFNSIVGTNPVGCVFSEYAIQDPQGWDYIRPILRENDGWAVFPYTPRGKNHGYDLYRMAEQNPDWYCEKLTVNDTGVISEKEIDEERKEGVDEELIQQEYYCSFQSPSQGSYYGKEMDRADAEDRIKNVPVDPDLLVDTWWDLGMGDTMAICFVQQHYNEVRFVDYYESCGEGLSHYKKVLQEKGYNYGNHIAPHDISVRELGTGVSRYETAMKLGIRFTIARKLPIDDGINAVRSLLANSWFDRVKCARLIDSLRNYHKEYDAFTKTWKARPFHDWSSHPCDAVRTGAVGRKKAVIPEKIDRYRKAEERHHKRHGSWMSG